LLSYLGADVRDNSELQPAQMLSELTDYVQAGFELAGPLLVHHPLQPFSRRYGTGEPGVLTYAGEWALERTGSAPRQPFCPAPLAPVDPAEGGALGLEELEAFLLHPPRHFLRHRLGVLLEQAEQAAEDDEPFALDFLTRYRLRHELLEARVRGQPLGPRLELFRLRGELPRGAFAGLALEPERAAAEGLGERVALLASETLPPLEVDLALGAVRLQGWLSGVTPGGLLTYRAAAFNGKDMVRLWLRHLVLNCVELPRDLPRDVTVQSPSSNPLSRNGRGSGRGVKKGGGTERLPRDSLHLEPEGAWRLSGWDRPGPARERLAGLLALYREGMGRPLPLMPRTGFAYAERLHATGDPGKALTEAYGRWRGNAYRQIPGEGDDPYCRVALRGTDPLTEGLPELARRLFAPALERLSDA
jgi:exodeoxyribonuclease V gamma subunit